MTDKVTLTPITTFQNDTTAATTYNANNAAVTAAMDNTLSLNGLAPNQMQANLDMNSNRLLNLPAPVSSNEPVRLQDLANAVAGPVTLSNLPVGGTIGQVLTKNSSSNYDASWLVIPSSGGGGGGGTGRTILTTPTTFYVSTAGSDVTGVGSLANPWFSRSHAYNTLQSKYDLGGQTVTVQLANGVYTDSLQATGPLVGQNGAGGLIFTGNTADATQVVIRPAALTGYAFSAAFGAQYQVQFFTIDMINSSADGIVVGQKSSINIGFATGLPNTSATLPSMIFMSPYGNGYNNISCAFGAFVQLTGNFSLRPSTYTTTATWSSGSTSVTLTSVAGITPGQFMGIEGTGIGPAANTLYSNTGALVPVSSNYITNVSGNVATLAFPTGAAGTGVIVQLTAGGQSFLDVGGGSSVYFTTNGQPNFSVYVDLNGFPFYSAGFVFQQGNAYNNIQAVTFIRGSQGRGPAFQVKGISAIDTGLQGVPYLPGWPPNLQGATWSAGANTITLGSAVDVAIGNTINTYANAQATFSSGATTIPVTVNTGLITPGMEVTGPGISSGTAVSSFGGGNVVLSAPTYNSQTNQTLFFTGGNCQNGNYVTFISGNTVSLASPTAGAGGAGSVLATSGIILTGSQYI